MNSEENTCNNRENTLSQSKGLLFLSGPPKENIFPAGLAWSWMLNCIWIMFKLLQAHGFLRDDTLKVERAGVSLGLFYCLL